MIEENDHQDNATARSKATEWVAHGVAIAVREIRTAMAMQHRGELENLLACHIITAAVQELLFTLRVPAGDVGSLTCADSLTSTNCSTPAVTAEVALDALQEAVRMDPGHHHMIAHILWLWQVRYPPT